MPLSFNEIRNRAAKFAKDWENAHYEKGQTQTFYNEFFEVFGKTRKNVAVYEKQVAKLSGNTGFIDLFWSGNLIVEQKSLGRDLYKARTQALDYFLKLNEKEKPRYILLSDFQQFELLDLETNETHAFHLSALHEKIGLFNFISGYQVQQYKDQDPVNIDAMNLMSALHNRLKDAGYAGRDLELLLVRIMFCLFAEDTGIFEKDLFKEFIENRTSEDGADLGAKLAELFQNLDTPENQRQQNMDDHLAAFPYVNGALFKDTIRIAHMDSTHRVALLQCCSLNWAKVSPALFGSLFQSVMDSVEQRKKGAHYTSEKNILKTIHPLFLDELREEFTRICAYKIGKKPALEKFHNKLAGLKFLDPACGCGNFLILAYRELRILELEVLEVLHSGDSATRVLDVAHFSKVDVDQFYGIEIEEFPAYIAMAAMWLVDHQMNMKLGEKFGEAFVRLPLKKSAKIVHANALRIDWKDVVSPKELSYILGNPPFSGSKQKQKEQGDEIATIFKGVKGAGNLDYVATWFKLAAHYIQDTNIKAAFVSTNSITQGEQVGILWPAILEELKINIFFAHRTFKWTIDEKKAVGMKIAAVHAVIIGFCNIQPTEHTIFEYDKPTSEPQKISATRINPYLVDRPNEYVFARNEPLCEAPEIGIGNKPIDGGYYLFTDREYEEFIRSEPSSIPYFRKWLGANELIKNVSRRVLLVRSIPQNEIRKMLHVIDRIEKVSLFRRGEIGNKKGEPWKKPPDLGTQKLADFPTKFHVENFPETVFIAIPETSSENRTYIPMGFFDPAVICSSLVRVVKNANLYHFGVLTSFMHMEWMRYTCGRLKSDYRYSNTLVYNNFPWPENVSETARKDIETKAQAVLDARLQFPNSTLADLYDPLTMPPELLKAHQALDKAVDKAYRKEPFTSERQRVEYLFEQYQKLTAPLLPVDGKKKRKPK
jgi:type I restriction-modification system DNA methylase subunit